MHPHIPRPRRKATRTCTDTAGVVRTVHGEFMWPFTARVNEKTAPIERIAAVAICRRLPPRCASDVQCPLWVKSGHMQHKRHVRFTPNSDRESEFPHKVMSAIPPKADMCSALTYVYFGAKADSCSAHKLQRRENVR